MIFVTKFDGSKQAFEKNKIINTCLRMDATPEIAKKVADRIEKEAYDGIQTKKILNLIFKYLKKYKPEVGHRIGLKEAISLLRSKPDFEEFVRLLLKEYGYEVFPNLIIRGKCIEHEVDAIAKKNDETIYVEIKHHIDPHTYTGLQVFLAAKSTFDDLIEGFQLGYNKINFNKALIICNTKISEHARRYAECRMIKHIGWKFPMEYGLEKMIEEKKLYPITLLRDLDAKTEEKLGNSGIVLLKQLIEIDINKLIKITGLSRNKLQNLKKKANELLSLS